MLSLHPQYVIDEQKHPQSVLLTLSEWKQVVNELEELEDIRAYDHAKSLSQEQVPFSQAVHEIEGDYDA